jgi:long-chain fatty acid transport protein
MRDFGKMGRAALGLASLSAAITVSETARANGFETPSNGTEQMGRGAAWLARATDPLATFYNPAALSRNGTSASVTVNLFFQKNCFQRVGPGGQPVQIGPDSEATYGNACNDVKPFPNPQLAFQYRVTDKLGIGIAVMGPSANGKAEYPTTQPLTYSKANTFTGMTQTISGAYPSGSRFILSELDAKIIWPQIAFGYEIAPRLRVGASFIWGIALLKFGNVSMGQNGSQVNNKGRLQETGDLELGATVTGKDLFVPGFVVSGLYEATDNLDIAAWYHWSDSVKASGQGDITGSLFEKSNIGKGASNPTVNHTPDNQAKITVPQPMEARIGARWHQPRTSVPEGGAAAAGARRIVDPMHDDVFDVELDLEWSHDKQFDTFGLTFPANTPIYVDQGTSPLSNVPTNADVPHKWKDTYGFRLGGDYVAIADKLSVRGGVWYQSSAIDPQYLHLDFIPAQRLGLTLGGTVRLGPVDVQAGFAHVFASTIDNGGNGSIYGLSGQAGSTNATSPLCPAGQPNRSECAVNGGKLTTVTNIASLGAVYRF